MLDRVEKFLEILPTITKEEADIIEDICNWDDEKKMAYKLAKGIFEETNKNEK